MTPKSLSDLNDEQIIKSWQKNVSPWINAIENKEIDSRIKTTNQAIVDTLIGLHPKTVLDIGCGEGWLCRALEQQGIRCLGIDVIPQFIEYAHQIGVGDFQCLSYETMSHKILNRKFDLLVANFSLLGKESVENIFHQAPGLLNPDGQWVIQTLHPDNFSPGTPSNEGWQPGSWQGFNPNFSDPAPWYFRDKKSWLNLFQRYGFKRVETIEPRHSDDQNLASIIFIGQR